MINANIALTYANDRLTDGAGAQLQRIYGVYSVSRFLGLPYVHSPIATIGYHGLAALESNAPVAGLEARYNSIFAIPSDVELPECHAVHTTTDVPLKLIRGLRILKGVQAAARIKGKFTLLRIQHPYSVADRYPEIYRHAAALSPFKRTRSEIFRLALHVRRGDEFVHETRRMQPNSYYVNCALRFATLLRNLGIPFVCELHTEVPSKAFVVTKTHHGLEGLISGDAILDPRMNRLEDFDVIPNLERFINKDPIETLERMATADALVISRSSFSYVAAILNPEGIIVYHPFWHSPLKEWLISDGAGVVSEADLTARLERWKRERSGR